MLILPKEHRSLFKDPFGQLYQSIDDIIPRIQGKTIYTVGDVVTHNIQKRGITPAIAVVDGYSMRLPCNRLPVFSGECIRVRNPAGTLTEDLIRALDYAVGHPPVTVFIDGEEDLSVIPLVISAPLGSVILYGQPHQGVVLRVVDKSAKEVAHNYLNHFIHND